MKLVAGEDVLGEEGEEDGDEAAEAIPVQVNSVCDYHSGSVSAMRPVTASCSTSHARAAPPRPPHPQAARAVLPFDTIRVQPARRQAAALEGDELRGDVRHGRHAARLAGQARHAPRRVGWAEAPGSTAISISCSSYSLLGTVCTVL